MSNFDPDAATVCIEHGAFIPCRREGWHYHTQNPRWVKAVRDYQSSTIEGLTWEPASDYAAHWIAHPPSCSIVGSGGACDCAEGRAALTTPTPGSDQP